MTTKLQLYTAPARIPRPTVDNLIKLAKENYYTVSELTSPRDPHDKAALHLAIHVGTTADLYGVMNVLNAWAAHIDADQLIDLTIYLTLPKALIELTRPAAGRHAVSRIAPTPITSATACYRARPCASRPPTTTVSSSNSAGTSITS